MPPKKKTPKTRAQPLSSAWFWAPFLLCLIVTGVLFAWELGFLYGYVPSLTRLPATTIEKVFTGVLLFLLSLNAGLASWQTHKGSCPIGAKRATGIAGMIGAISILCPVCLMLPASLIGASIFFAFVAEYLPLLRIVAVILLVISATMLWPKR
jgi:hypothetical protein